MDNVTYRVLEHCERNVPMVCKMVESFVAGFVVATILAAAAVNWIM